MKNFNLLKQSSFYSLGNFVVSIIGIITFPILTKNLSVEEYGIVGLLAVSIGLISSLCKLGLQHSVIRFYSEYSYPIFISNALTVTTLTTAAISIIAIAFGLLTSNFLPSILFQTNFWVGVVIIAALGSYQSFIYKLLVAKQKSFLMSTLSVIRKLLTTLFIVVIILAISKTAEGYVYALLFAEILFSLLITVCCIKINLFSSFKTKLINKDTIHAFLIFAIPMTGFEIANMVHAFIDRFFIEFFLSKEELGLYSAPYNMASIVNNIVLGGIATAVIPIYLNTWKKEGRIATEKLLSSINNFFFLFLPVIIAGLYSIAEPLMGILATDEYKKHAYLLPIISTGIFIHGANVVFAAGLQIKKDTKKIFRYVLESMTINIVLNLLLIPKYGITAAAVVTVISYLWMAIRYTREGKKVVVITFDWRLLSRSIIYAVLVTAVVMQIDLINEYFLLAARSFFGITVFTGLVLIFEKNIRTESLAFLKNRFNLGRNTNSN